MNKEMLNNLQGQVSLEDTSRDFATMKLCGRLTINPELHSSAGKKDYTSFSIAVNNAKGKAKFFRVVAFEEMAVKISMELKKGDRVTLIGVPNITTYKNNESVQVVAHDYIMSPKIKKMTGISEEEIEQLLDEVE